jgi:PPOX class probable F420-dependent enzyme
MTAGKSSLLSRFTALQYKVLDGLRHPRAFEVASQPGTEADFAGLRGARQCLVVTFKRSGEPVPTPVNFGLSDEGKLYFRCEPYVAKIRRLRRDPHVRVCPCSFRGKPLGPSAEATARVLSDSETEPAHAIIAANWDPASRVLERGIDRIGVELVYVEVTPAG